MSVHGDDAERVRRLQRVTDAALSHLALEDLLGALLVRTREVLEVEFPELGRQIAFHVPDEHDKRHGQAIAAASLPEIAR